MPTNNTAKGDFKSPTHSSQIINSAKRNTSFLLTLVLLMLIGACHRSSCELSFQTEVTNKVLYREILAYHDSILLTENAKLLLKGDSVYVWVHFKALNDSMTRYSLEYLDDMDMLSTLPAEFICTVGGHLVFFSAAGGNSQCDFKHHYFGIPSQQRETLLKRYFPTKYKVEQKKKKELKETGYTSYGSA